MGGMELKHEPDVIARVQMIMDLYEAAEEMMRLKLRREHPDETDEQIEERLLSWLRKDEELTEPLPPWLGRRPLIPQE
jgi:uncharacterized protein YaeQ